MLRVGNINMFKKAFRHIPVVIYDSLATHQVNGPYQIVMKHIHAGWINSHVWLVESIWFWSIQLLVAFFKKYHGIICKIPEQFDQIKDHINRFPRLIRKLIFMCMFIPFVDSFPMFIPYVIKLISNVSLAWCISNFGWFHSHILWFSLDLFHEIPRLGSCKSLVSIENPSTSFHLQHSFLDLRCTVS